MNGKCQTGSARAIMNFLKRLENQGICMHGFLLMHRDEILAEGYWKPFRAEIPHRMYSVSKSMTSLAIGLLIGEGKISFEDAIIKYFADMLPPTVPPQLNRLTIRDMLRMATCYARTTYREGEDRDWIRTYFPQYLTMNLGLCFLMTHQPLRCWPRWLKELRVCP